MSLGERVSAKKLRIPSKGAADLSDNSNYTVNAVAGCFIPAQMNADGGEAVYSWRHWSNRIVAVSERRA
jgi:hypothetical protein